MYRIAAQSVELHQHTPCRLGKDLRFGQLATKNFSLPKFTISKLFKFGWGWRPSNTSSSLLLSLSLLQWNPNLCTLIFLAWLLFYFSHALDYQFLVLLGVGLSILVLQFDNQCLDKKMQCLKASQSPRINWQLLYVLMINIKMSQANQIL